MAIETRAMLETDDPEIFEVLSAPADLEKLKGALLGAGIPVASAESTMVPGTKIALEGAQADKMMSLIEELENYDVTLDPQHPYPAVAIVESMARVHWKSEAHRERFPDARGYALTVEEDLDVYEQVLKMWREQKKTEPAASYGFYDLLLAIDDAGHDRVRVLWRTACCLIRCCATMWRKGCARS